MQTYMNCSRHWNLGECSNNLSPAFYNSLFPHWLCYEVWRIGGVPCKMHLCTFIIKIDLWRKPVSWLAPRTLVIIRSSSSASSDVCSCSGYFVTRLHSSSCPCCYCCWWFYFEKQAHVSWPLTPCVLDKDFEFLFLLSLPPEYWQYQNTTQVITDIILFIIRFYSSFLKTSFLYSYMRRNFYVRVGFILEI